MQNDDRRQRASPAVPAPGWSDPTRRVPLCRTRRTTVSRILRVTPPNIADLIAFLLLAGGAVMIVRGAVAVAALQGVHQLWPSRSGAWPEGMRAGTRAGWVVRRASIGTAASAA